MATDMQDAAARYCSAYGMALVPLRPRSKIPILNDWGNHLIFDADTAAKYYRQHPDANIGVALGDSHLCSFDIDDLDAVRIICAEFGFDLDATFRCPTIRGKSSGARVIFSIPDQVALGYHKLTWPVRDNPAKKFTVFELRAAKPGDARQDVFPPSIHPDTGEPYIWLTSPNGSFPEPPVWLLALWQNFAALKPQMEACCPWAGEKPRITPTRALPGSTGSQHAHIERFVAEHEIEAVLTQYGYTKAGKRWLSPYSTTGLPGVHILDGGRCWIHHASDPLCSAETGQPVSSFDLFRQYEHGGDNSAAFRAVCAMYEPERQQRQRFDAYSVPHFQDGPEPPPVGELRKAPVIEPAKSISWPSLEGRNPPPREWAIDHWLGIGHPTLCVGVGGIGKTLLTQQLGSCLSVGASFIGAVQRPLRVLMWGCEDDHDEFWRRQIQIASALGRPLSDFSGLFIVPRLGLDNTLITTEFGRPIWTALIGELEEQVADLDVDVVILDNMGQMFGAKDERHSVTMFINGIVGACQKRKPTAQILLAHPARAEGSEFSGSGAWENSVRMRWFFSNKLPDAKPDEETAPDSDSGRYLAKRKANYTARDYVKFEYSEGAYVTEAENLPDGFASHGDFRFAQAKRVIIDGIRALTAMKIFASEKPSSTFLPKLLLEYKLSEGIEKSILTEAMRQHLVRGIISRVVVGKMSNREPRYGLIVTADWGEKQC